MSDLTTIRLPRFQSALRKRPISTVDLETDTYYRYRDGRVPTTFVRFLIRHPDLARELLADIEAYTEEFEQAA
jgi:hypothetical protein